MNNEIIDNYLNKFEEDLRMELLTLCSQDKWLNKTLLESQDITDYWLTVEEKYIADAVPNVQQYPLVSVGWAAYLGMAVAYCWDVDWSTYRAVPYEQFYGDEGFDNMDDHIVRDILAHPLDSQDALRLRAVIQRLAQATVGKIRHEQIEPSTPMAYHIFIRACRAMFAIGAAIQLHALGYKFEKL